MRRLIVLAVLALDKKVVVVAGVAIQRAGTQFKDAVQSV